LIFTTDSFDNSIVGIDNFFAKQWENGNVTYIATIVDASIKVKRIQIDPDIG
jgi:hypothetical protein